MLIKQEFQTHNGHVFVVCFPTEWLPDEIRRLGPKVVDLYTKAQQKGTFTNNIIRCMFVGHYGVGKTTLVKQLQGLSAVGVESTDGVDVYRGKCYYNMETKEWITPGYILKVM